MIPRLGLLLLLGTSSLLLAAGNSSADFGHKRFRLAYYLFGEELGSGNADGYLRRAAQADYNYLVAEFHLDSDPSFPGIRAKKGEFVQAFRKAHEFGLKMIPKIQLGSKWSLHWKAANNPKIAFNIFYAGGRAWGCPSFAPEPEGIDASFEELLKVLGEAFKEASVPYDLEFIDLGHDEPVDSGFLLIGGVPDSVAGPGDRFSPADRSFVLDRISQQGESVSTAFQTLVVNELHRRVTQVRRILGNHVRILVYGDLWDPQANGGVQKKTFLESVESCFDGTGQRIPCSSQGVARKATEPGPHRSKMTPGIASLPGLSEAEKQIIRSGVVLRPWCYYVVWPFGEDPERSSEYDASASFDYLARHGLTFIYTSVHHERPTDKAYTEGEDRAMKRYAKACRDFPKHCVGYTAAPWETRWQEPPHTPPIFDTLEELRDLNRETAP